MVQTYTNLITHIVFSTKGRVEIIDQEMMPKLLAYMSGIIRNINCNPLKINGIADHVHLLIHFPPTKSISEIVQSVKANSSRWVHENYPLKQAFAWQTGYGAFSVSRSVVPKVAEYIENQQMHHTRISFKGEYVVLLKKHKVDYDEQSIWQ